MSPVPTASDLSHQMRIFQEANPLFGPLFASVHAFIDRTIAQFFKEDEGLMPHPFVSFEQIYSERKAEHHTQDGYTLTDKIIIDPFKVRDGVEVAEVLAHELVHVWQRYLGYPMVDNVHEQNFHDKMMDYGIATQEGTGNHIGTIGDIWNDWLKENEDLKLDTFVLGEVEGMTSMTVWKCPDCGIVAMTHKHKISITCSNTDECWSEMEKV